MPTLEWIGKEEVMNHHLAVPCRALEEEYTYNAKVSENMIIRGDNLEALKALLPRYEGRVRCIYIDPPYNTGNEGWVYNDNVNDPRLRKWLGETVGREGEDLSRHDKWLCMMYPRLKLLQRLLAEDGAIFISIDDNELYNLKAVCDEIFGAGCFVSRITWQNNYSLRNDAKGIPYETDNILVYGKSVNWSPKRLARTEEMDARYVNYDDDAVPYKVTPIHAPGASAHKNMVYAIQHPMTGKLMYPPQGRHWKDGQDKLLNALCQWAPYELRIIDDAEVRARICGEAAAPDVPAIMLSVSVERAKELAAERYRTHPWPAYFFLAKGLGSIQAKTYLDNSKGRVVSTLWRHEDAGTNVEATNELKALMSGAQMFDTPKPSRLLERIIRISTEPDSIILDAFAGSGTTAHAVLNVNKADGGRRRFILVEMMDYAERITAERVKRAIDGYGQGKTAVEGTGGDFTFYRLGPALLLPGGALNEDAGAEKIREYVYFTETGSAIGPGRGDEPYYMGVHQDNAYYFCYERGRVTALNRAFLHGVKTRAGRYTVYADLCTLSAAELEKYHITFKKISRDISWL